MSRNCCSLAATELTTDDDMERCRRPEGGAEMSMNRKAAPHLRRAIAAGTGVLAAAESR
jgi:hypothetical protein